LLLKKDSLKYCLLRRYCYYIVRELHTREKKRRKTVLLPYRKISSHKEAFQLACLLTDSSTTPQHTTLVIPGHPLINASSMSPHHTSTIPFLSSQPTLTSSSTAKPQRKANRMASMPPKITVEGAGLAPIFPKAEKSSQRRCRLLMYPK